MVSIAISGRVNLARPKSSTLTGPRWVRNIFAALMSRWMIPLAVRGVERIGKLNTPFQQAIDRYRARAQAPVKRLPLQQLHCNKGLLTSPFPPHK